MSKRQNVILLRGTFDGLTFYVREGKQYVRRKSTLSSDRVRSDPSFAPTMAEARKFGVAAKRAKDLRRAISPFDSFIPDAPIHPALTALFRKLPGFDQGFPPIADHDYRYLSLLLQAFEFNWRAPFSSYVRLGASMLVHPRRDFVSLECEVPAPGIFMRKRSSPEFRLHFVLAPLRGALPRSAAKGVTDWSRMATWSSDWLDSRQSVEIVQPLEVPRFMLDGSPILALMVVEPGSASSATGTDYVDGRAVRVIDIF